MIQSASDRPGQMVPPANPEINLHIQHIVLENINITDESIFIDALQQELTRLLTASVPLETYQSFSLHYLKGGEVVGPVTASPEQIAGSVAQGIYAALVDAD